MTCLVFSVWTHHALADPDPRYRPGDWRGYTTVRYVTSVAFTPDWLYFGTRGGIARYDRNLDRWVVPFTISEGLPANAVVRLAYDPLTDELYAETTRGYSRLSPIWHEWRDVSTFPDSLVQGWQSVDLTRYQLPVGFDALDPGYLTDPHLRAYRIIGGEEDSRGTLWLGTWGEFVWKLPWGVITVEPQSWGLFHDNVEAIFVDSSRVYFGGTNYYANEGALSIYDTVASRWTYAEARFTSGFTSDHIHQFAGEPNGRFLWMATDAGVVRLDRRTMQFRTFGQREGLTDERVWSLCVDGDIVWVGTETGVEGIYIPSDSVFFATTAPVVNARVAAIDVTGDVVWLGTDRGLFRLVKPVPEWQFFSLPTGPLSGRVRAIRHDDHQVYVGTERGIVVIDRLGTHLPVGYDRSEGLPDDNVFDLAVTDSILWAATRSGLVRFVPATRERRVITAADGLLDPLVQTIVVDGDYLWLGTEHGASRFRWNNPERID
ncbi:MAG: hypothetical protein AB1792_09345 [Candidatus Zixiibacteriota bacterium]